MIKHRVWWMEDGWMHSIYVKADNMDQALAMAREKDERFNIVQANPYPNYGIKEVIEYEGNCEPYVD